MRKGVFYTSYFSNIRNGIGTKVSISRFNPKWLKESDIDHWLSDLAPSISLLNRYKNQKIDWQGYEEEYRKFSDSAAKEIMGIVDYLDGGNDITVYCYEKPGDNCHRHILADIISQLGYKTKEI